MQQSRLDGMMAKVWVWSLSSFLLLIVPTVDCEGKVNTTKENGVENVREENTFDSSMDGWSVSNRSWTRVSLGLLARNYSTELQLTDPGPVTTARQQELDSNFVLVPFDNSPNSSELIVSTMSRDISLSAGSTFEFFFSVLLLHWNSSIPEDATDDQRRSMNPRLQIFYDEDLVFDIAKAVAQHGNHFTWTKWNEFKMLSRYREKENLTVAVIGSGGLDPQSLVVLDKLVISVTNPTDPNRTLGGFEDSPRLEPEAEWKNGDKGWSKVETEAEEEALEEENEANHGRPAFCALLPERGPCVMLRTRYFFNATSGECERFLYGGCRGNENRFEDLTGCEKICKDRAFVEPIKSSVRSSEYTTFEEGFATWEVHSWSRLDYSSQHAKDLAIPPSPSYIELPNIENKFGAIPEYHMFDFRQPEMNQQFNVPKGASLLLEFNLVVQGLGHPGFLSFFLRLDPGFNVYVGNIKVFDFKQHGINDGGWHRYRLTMNESEVEEHRIESGEEFLLITAKGWLGSGKRGAVVLDNVNITHITEEQEKEAEREREAREMKELPMNKSSSLPPLSSPHPGCLEEKMVGECKAAFTRFYYSLTTDACIQYEYSGCGGNSNTFVTEEECLDKCVGGGTTLFTQGLGVPVENDNDPERICALPAEQGLCKARIDRFFFDPKTGDCQTFEWGGCKGNENKFSSKTECEQFCAPIMTKENQTALPQEISKTPTPMIKTTTTTVSRTSQQSSIASSATSGSSSETTKVGETTSGFSTSRTTTYPSVRPTWPPKGWNESSCELQPDRGSCKQELVRYFYSPKQESCFTFTWSGCGGNDNRFTSENQCYTACEPEEEDWGLKISGEDTRESEEGSDEDEEDLPHFFFPFRFLPPPKPEDNSPGAVCSLPQSPGPCRPSDPANYLTRFFHNQATNSCLPFRYGGCGGNHNNFENKSDCEVFCSVEVKKAKASPLPRSACSTSPRRGTCHLNLPRWYFSHWDNICKPYNYSGCGANLNHFISEVECLQLCPPKRFTGHEPRCEKLRERGNCTNKQERFFFDSPAARCVRFGACPVEGEENNFETRAECQKVCLGVVKAPLGEAQKDNGGVGGGGAATAVVEVVLVLILIAMSCLAVYLGWRHYKTRQGGEAYRVFVDERSPSVISADLSREVGRFENPVYETAGSVGDMQAHLHRRDSRIEIPALSLSNLGSRQIEPVPEDSTA